MLGHVASRLLGLVREQTIAALFGTTAAASVFSAATRVPTMVYDLLIGGAITAALVPVFSEYAALRQPPRSPPADRADPTGNPAQLRGRPGPHPAEPDSEAALGALAGAVIGLTLAVLIPVVTLLVLFARPLMSLLGVGFEPAVQEQGIWLVRLTLPSVILLGVAAVFMGVLYALNRVTLPSFSAAVYNLGIIGCALALAPRLGVTSLALGVLVGAAGQVVLQWPGLRDLDLRLSFQLTHPSLRRIIQLYAPVAGGLVVSAAVVTLDTRLASSTGPGSLAAMRYATTLIQLPLGLVATALAFASLPVLSRYGAAGATAAGFRHTLAMGLKAALLLVVPAMVILIVLRGPIVRLLFQRGAFGDEGAALTALALLYYAPQLPFVAVDQLLIAAFYALQNTRLPVLVGVFGAFTYAIVALSTVERMGMPGLVLANTIQNSGHAVMLLVLLRRTVSDLGAERIGLAAARIGLAACLMTMVLLMIQMLIPPPVMTLSLATYLALAVALSGAIYVVALIALGSEEMMYVRDVVRLRFDAGQARRP